MSLQSDHISSDVSQRNSLSDDMSQSVMPSGNVNLVSSTENNATDSIAAPGEDALVAMPVVQQFQDSDVKQIAVSSVDLESGDVPGMPSIGSSFVKVCLSSEEAESKDESICKENNNIEVQPAENVHMTESSEITHQTQEIIADGLATENETNQTETENHKSDEGVHPVENPSQTSEICESLEDPNQVSENDTSLQQQETAKQYSESFEQIPCDSSDLELSEVPTRVGESDEILQSDISPSPESFQQVESLTEDSFSIIEESMDNQSLEQKNDINAELPSNEGTVESIEAVQVTEEVNKCLVENTEVVQGTEEVHEKAVENIEHTPVTEEAVEKTAENIEHIQIAEEMNKNLVENVEPVQGSKEVNEKSVEYMEHPPVTEEVHKKSVEEHPPVTEEVHKKSVEEHPPVTEEVHKKSVEEHPPVTEEVHKKSVENIEHIPVTEEVIETSKGKAEDAKEKNTKEDEWMDILGNQLLKKKVIVKGLGHDSRPERGQEVTIQYESLKEDGSVYEPNQSLTFIIADGDVCEALDLSVNLMQKGETCTVISDVKFCYKKAGDPRPSTLPKTGTLTYTIQLTTVQDGPYNTSVSIEHRLKWAENKKQEGNSFYGRKNFQSSVTSYKKCLAVLKQALNQENVDEKVRARVMELTVKCYNNVAASHLQLNEWGRAVTACTDAEMLDSNNVKTLLRKGKALSQLGKDQDAVGVLKKASKIDPDAKDVQNELVRVTKKMTAQKEAQKKMCERMFGGGQTNKKAEEEPSSSIFSWKSPFVYGSSAVMLAAVIIGLFMYQKQ